MDYINAHMSLNIRQQTGLYNPQVSHNRDQPHRPQHVASQFIRSSSYCQLEVTSGSWCLSDRSIRINSSCDIDQKSRPWITKFLTNIIVSLLHENQTPLQSSSLIILFLLVIIGCRCTILLADGGFFVVVALSFRRSLNRSHTQSLTHSLTDIQNCSLL